MHLLPILRRHEERPSGCIYITSLCGGSEQSYGLIIEKDYIAIKGAENSGVLYGIQTLRQIIRQSGAVLPALLISDAPSMACRGFYFDTSRGRVPTLEYLKRLADTLSYYKLNQLQLYIEHSYLFENLSEVWRDDTPLTAEDILELGRYCHSLQIELVPSLASFGHLYKLLSTKTYHHLCELDGSDTTPFSFADRMAHHTIDVTNPESLTLIQNLLLEYMQLFTSKFFNICADETFDLGKGKSKKSADKNGVTGVYINFLNKISRFILDHGRIPMFWSDVLLSEDKINRQISVVEYGNNTESLCNFFKNLSPWGAFPWYHVVRTLETLANTGDVKAAAKVIRELDASHVSEYNAEIDKQLNVLYTYLGTSKPYTQNTIYAYIIAAEGQKLLNLLLPIFKHTLAGEPAHSSIPPAKLSSMLEKWLVVYRKLWKTTSKESEFYRIANLFFYCADYLRTLSV